MAVKGAFSRAEDVAVEAGLTQLDAIQPMLLDVDRDFAMALVPSGARLSLGGIAELLGAQRVRMLGAQQTRGWLARQTGQNSVTASRALAWWEVPFLTGLPAIAARDIMRRELVIVPTGDPGWVVRLRSNGLVRSQVHTSVRSRGRNRDRPAVGWRACLGPPE